MSSSIVHRVARTCASFKSVTSAGAFERWYFSSGSWPSDLRTSSRSRGPGTPSSLNQAHISAYSYTRGPWLPSATVRRRQAAAGKAATTSSTRLASPTTRA